jgi:mitochondrial fission protein ELM1
MYGKVMNFVLPQSSSQPTDVCWVVTDGKPGMENQALGLAEALEMEISIKRTKLRFPWSLGAPYLQLGLSACLSRHSDPLTAPWPHLLIASGRQSVLPALYVKQASNQNTKVVYIQDPVISPKNFDLVVAPLHDNLTGHNVLITQGALHRVTHTRLTAAKLLFPQLQTLPSPRFAILLGGSNRSYTFDDTVAHDLAVQLHRLQQTYQAGLLISPSRRTETHHIDILRSRLTPSNTYIWDNTGANPYFAILAWADAIFVTCDSISMITEACSTGKPVYMLRLPGGDPKFERFHNHMVQKGYVRWFDGSFNPSPTNTFNETAFVAQQVKDLLRSSRQA